MKRYLGRAINVSVFSLFVASACLFGGAESHAGEKEQDKAAVSRLNAVKQAHLARERGAAIKVKAGVQSRDDASKAPMLIRVKADEVNMATNHYEGAKQNTVTIDNKVYHVGASGYARHITANPSTRFSRDPFTGKAVDKAEAVIFADASSRVHYFESEETYKAFVGLADNAMPQGYSN